MRIAVAIIALGAVMPRFTNETAYENEIAAARRTYPSVPASVIKAVIAAESSFRPDAYLEEAGGDGSIGLMQLRLSTAKGVGYYGTKANLFLSAVNIYYGTALLADLAHRLNVGTTGDWPAVFSAYNGGIRTSLAFGSRATEAQVAAGLSVCLRRDPVTKRCVSAFRPKAGQFGNQGHVDRVLGHLRYFGGGTADQPPTGRPGAAPLILAALAAGALAFAAGSR